MFGSGRIEVPNWRGGGVRREARIPRIRDLSDRSHNAHLDELKVDMARNSRALRQRRPDVVHPDVTRGHVSDHAPIPPVVRMQTSRSDMAAMQRHANNVVRQRGIKHTSYE